MLFANIVILAHAVVPHHHHNKSFAAVVNILGGHADEERFHAQCANSHHHDNDSGECLINEAYALAKEAFEQNNMPGYDDNQPGYDADFGRYIVVAQPEMTACAYRQQPYDDDDHLAPIHRTNGLRAPPFC